MHRPVKAVHNMHMLLRELMNESLVETGAELFSKNEALTKLIALQKSAGAIHNPRALRREVDMRERQGGCAVSGRIAISDVMHSGSKSTSVAAVTVKNGVDCGAPDKRPVRLLFMIAGKSGTNEHKAVKEQLLRLLSDPGFCARLCAAKNSREFLALLSEREKSRSYGRR